MRVYGKIMHLLTITASATQFSEAQRRVHLAVRKHFCAKIINNYGV